MGVGFRGNERDSATVRQNDVGVRKLGRSQTHEIVELLV